MTQKISADYIYSPHGWLVNYVVEISKEGEILDLREKKTTEKVDFMPGILCPGFVNAHCHIELSGLKDKIERNSGMAKFGEGVVRKRQEISAQENEEAMKTALKLAWESGTQAIGDICNDTSSLYPKSLSPQIHFHHFLEIFSLREDAAEGVLVKAKERLLQFPAPATLTLHAPYSASETLLKLTQIYFQQHPHLASIHLLESKDEREVFEKGSGYFADFFRRIGINFQGFPTKSPIEYIEKAILPHQPLLFIHLTQATEAEINLLSQKFPHAYFVLCPDSNLYIHHTLPQLQNFSKVEEKICIGTDSLASNTSLEMLKEIETLHQHYPQIPLHTFFTWLTINGAKALKMQDEIGSFEKGKIPGILSIQGIEIEKNTFSPAVSIKRLR